MPTVLTACPRNCYSTCALRVTVEDGRLVRVEGDPSNRATAEGPCLKGLAYVERAHSPQRLTRPLRRRADGTIEPVTGVSLYQSNFGAAGQKFEAARVVVERLQTHLRETAQAERAGRLEIVAAHLRDAQHLAASLDASAHAAAEEAIKALQ